MTDKPHGIQEPRFLLPLRHPAALGGARHHRAQSGARRPGPGAGLLHRRRLWLLLEAEFLAITLVLVYVGAVMVLFLFVVMMLDINLEELRKGFWSYLPRAGLVAGLMVVEMVMVLGGQSFGLIEPTAKPADFSNTKELGRLLYTDYVYAFELAAVILLVAMVAAIALTLRRRPNRKIVDPAWQVKQKRADRVYMVNLKSQKPSAKTEDDE
jgi:NADH-quinone oxidoreductase subunit J